MDRRSLISGALGGAAGVVVGRELVPSAAGAAADVDRSEFEALQARVAWLEQFHDPMPPPHVPKFSGAVSLPAGFVVPFGEVWDFDPDVSTTVEVGANVVVAGTLQMRPANPGVKHALRFVGVNDAGFVGGGMEPLASDVGLWVVGAGVLDLAGSPKHGWVRAADTVPANAAGVGLAVAPDGWQAGDEIAITPTRVGNWTEYDVRQVGGVSGTTVALSAPTTYAHPATNVGPGFRLAAEVLNLSRNVSIEGTATGRAHVWINSSAQQTISHVELRHLGPWKSTNGGFLTGVMGRYPLHFHMCGDGSRGSVVTGVVVRDSNNRAFVTHDSHGVTYRGCVAHNVNDDAYWWDPAPALTKDVSYEGCVASLIRCEPYYNGYRLTGFNLGIGTGCSITDCVSVGVQGNVNASGFLWPEAAVSSPKLWVFKRNIAHNNKVAGIFVWQNNPDPHVVEDFVCYHNGQDGIQHGAYSNGYVYRNGYLYGNGNTQLLVWANCWGPLTFERLHIDSAGRTGHSIAAVHHARPTSSPTEFRGCTIIGHTQRAFWVIVHNATANPDMSDFIECGDIDITWGASLPAGTVTRVQNAGTATERTPSTTTSIAPFSTWTGPAPTPFVVMQAA